MKLTTASTSDCPEEHIASFVYVNQTAISQSLAQLPAAPAAASAENFQCSMDSFDNAVEAGTIVFFDTARDNDAAPICSYVASNGRACRSAATGPQYCVSHTCRTPDCLRPKRSREPICLECKDLNNSCLAELNGEEMYPPAPAEQPRRPTEFGIKSFDPAVSPRACTTTVHVTVEEDLYSGFPDVADAAPETGKPVNPEASAPKHVTVEEDLYSGFPDVADAAPETGKPVNPEASAPKPPAAYVNIFVRR